MPLLAPFLLAAALGLPNDDGGARAVVSDMNLHRRALSRAPLQADPALEAIALERADDMEQRSFFAHVNPDGKTAFDALQAEGIGYTIAGENIALASSLDLAQRGLWNSSEHRDNILEARYRRTGVAVVHAPQGRIYVVEIFSD